MGAGALPSGANPPATAPGFQAEAVRENSLIRALASHFAHSMNQATGGDRSSLRMGLSRWTSYFGAFEELLKPLRHKEGAVVVEIGGFMGGSAQVLSEWLGPEVELHVVDLAGLGPLVSQLPGRVRAWQADQANVTFWRDEFLPAVGPIDAVLDDGGHTWRQQLITLREVYPHVKPGGFVAVEDTHTSYFWPFCGRFQETELVASTLQREPLRADLEGGGALNGFGAWGVKGRGGTQTDWADIQGAPSNATEAAILDSVRMLQTRVHECTTSSSGTLPAFTFIDEALSLSHDLHRWWWDTGMEQPLFRGAESAGITWKGLYADTASRLEAAQRARRSLLGLEWRRWFARHTESVSVRESIVVFRRWRHELGRGPPVEFTVGSAQPRKEAVGDVGGIMDEVPTSRDLDRLGSPFVEAVMRELARIRTAAKDL